MRRFMHFFSAGPFEQPLEVFLFSLPADRFLDSPGGIGSRYAAPTREALNHGYPAPLHMTGNTILGEWRKRQNLTGLVHRQASQCHVAKHPRLVYANRPEAAGLAPKQQGSIHLELLE